MAIVYPFCLWLFGYAIDFAINFGWFDIHFEIDYWQRASINKMYVYKMLINYVRAKSDRLKYELTLKLIEIC